MIFVDDRTEEEKKTHPVAWGGTDSFMSGWGAAEGGSSYAFWAFPEGYGNKVESWVRGRGEMRRVREIILDGYKPTGRGHCHIYVVNPGHPSIG